jgi:hypothetical protein
LNTLNHTTKGFIMKIVIFENQLKFHKKNLKI